MYYSSGSVDQVVESELYFTDDLDMMAGQNGSPVVFNSGGVDIVLGLATLKVKDVYENGKVKDTLRLLAGYTKGEKHRDLALANPEVIKVY